MAWHGRKMILIDSDTDDSEGQYHVQTILSNFVLELAQSACTAASRPALARLMHAFSGKSPALHNLVIKLTCVSCIFSESADL